MIRVKQKGFTLVELLISVVILGILMAIVGPMFSTALTFMSSAKKSEVQLNNQKLAAGMLSYARNNGGQLPAKQNNYRLYDEGAEEGTAGYQLYLELTGTGVPTSQINTAGYGVDAVKRYQVVGGLKHTQPLFVNTGDNVTLTYQVGVIYQTDCPKGGGCDGAAIPDHSATGSETGKLTEDNIASWDVKGADHSAIMINTLAEQKVMLRVTIGRLNRLSDRISSHYYAKARASESSGENFFAGQAQQETAATTDGCWTAWDNLSSSDTLTSIGLSRGEYGKTAWNGNVEYCRDYKPTGLGGQPPFYAALRINRDLKEGSNPDNLQRNNNVIITF